MNMDAENSVTVKSFILPGGIRLGTKATLAVSVIISSALAAILIFSPMTGKTVLEKLTAYAVKYAGTFSFDGTAAGFVSSISRLTSDEMYLSLIFLVSPAVVFRRQLAVTALSLRMFFSTVCVLSVLQSDVSLYGALAASASYVSSSATAIFFAYSAISEVAGIAKFTLRILSALGSFVIFEIIILIPSAFI